MTVWPFHMTGRCWAVGCHGKRHDYESAAALNEGNPVVEAAIEAQRLGLGEAERKALVDAEATELLRLAGYY